MPINRTFYKTISWGTILTPNFISLIFLVSLLRVAITHPHGWVVWKPFTIQKQMGKEIIEIGFCTFGKVAIVIMPNFVNLILGTSWTNMEVQE